MDTGADFGGLGLLVAVATLLVGCSTAIAIPLSEIIRVERAKLEYESVDYQVYCEFGQSQTPAKECAAKKAKFRADLVAFLNLVGQEFQDGAMGAEMKKQRQWALNALKTLQP